jgi:hypothetical protein
MRATNRLLPGAALLILTALSACDNVRWGGAEVQFVPPPPASGSEQPKPDQQTFAQIGLPAGTVLFHVVKAQGGAMQVIPVGEVSGDSLRTIRRPAGVAPQAYESRFREAVFSRAGEFTLFRRGAAVGTLTINGDGPVTACGVPTAIGTGTTVAAAADAAEFLAFRKGLAPDVKGEYTPPPVTGSINTFASIVAERLVLQNGLARPRSWPGAKRDLQAIEVGGAATPEMAATYLAGDDLRQGAGEPEGWSVFYMASYESRSGYTPFYSEVHDYRREPKAAPRLVDYLNWNGRGTPDVLIQVYGPNDTRYEVVSGDRGGRWQKVWESSPCTRSASANAAR